MRQHTSRLLAAVIFIASSAVSGPMAAKSHSDTTREAAASGITLDTLLPRAIAHSPRLQSVEAAKAAAIGERGQAGLWQNPELALEAENVGGDGPYRNADAAEVTYGVSQLIEIGGKRAARVDVANRAIDLAESDLQAVRLDVIREVTEAFNEAVAAAEEVKLAEEQAGLADDMLKAVTKRVDAAREPLIQESKAQVALATSRVALVKAKRDQQTAQQLLARLTGETGLPGALDASGFFDISEPADIGEVTKALAANPDLSRWQSAIARNEADLDLAKANAIPDPRLSAGFRQFRETNNNAFVVGLSIPIPLFNQNQGNIARAQADVTRAVRDQAASELTLGSELTRSLQAQQAAYTQAATLKDSILPAAKKAYTLSRQGYQSGKSAYLEVLDAARTLTDARFQYVEALKEFHNQRAAVERLTATHLPLPPATETSHDQE